MLGGDELVEPNTSKRTCIPIFVGVWVGVMAIFLPLGGVFLYILENHTVEEC